MPSCLISTGEENLTVTAAAARRLLERGDGDAALLYLALLRHRGTVMPRSLAGELRWDRTRIEAAEASELKREVFRLQQKLDQLNRNTGRG